MTLIWITLFGILGIWSRYGADLFLGKSQNGFPLATITVNIIGCFLIGLLTTHPKIPAPIKTGLIVGFCGGLTTFSSYALQVNELSQKNLTQGFLYLISSIVLGLGALVLSQKFSFGS